MSEILKKFAADHGLTLVEKGEVGIGRDCVGFLSARGSGYVDFNPYDHSTYEQIEALCDRRLRAPAGVEDAYHKHDCLAVLVHDEKYDEALRQLELWVMHLNDLGVEVVTYATGAKGIQALVSGFTGYALKVKAE